MVIGKHPGQKHHFASDRTARSAWSASTISVPMALYSFGSWKGSEFLLDLPPELYGASCSEVHRRRSLGVSRERVTAGRPGVGTCL
jgi:hypothetical protein